MRKMRKMRNCAQLIFVSRKMREFAPTRKPVPSETLIKMDKCRMFGYFTEKKCFQTRYWNTVYRLIGMVME